MKNLNDGFLIINKPNGISSRQLVDRIKKLTSKKVGHTGTLDPLATGMMVICIGEATKFSQWVITNDKAYDASIKFGTQTATDDAEGDAIAQSNQRVSEKQLISELVNFSGKIQQQPPQFSAIHINGKRAYKLARAEKSFEMPSREVQINEIKLLEFNDEKQIAKLYISCQSGTYIRSIARDLGLKLGCYAHLYDLYRKWISPFENFKLGAYSTENLEVISLETYFSDIASINCYVLSDTQVKSLAYGRPISLDGDHSYAAFHQGTFIGIIEPSSTGTYKSTRLRANVLSTLS